MREKTNPKSEYRNSKQTAGNQTLMAKLKTGLLECCSHLSLF
jgi:hypothetical protein